MLPWILLSAALAVEPAVVSHRLEEVKALRSLRIDKGAPEIPVEAYEQAAKGRITTGLVAVEGHAARKAWGVAVFEVPIARYWSAINDDAGKVTWTKLTYAEVLEGGACASPRRVFQFLPVPLLTDRWWVFDMTTNKGMQSASDGRMREMRWATDGDFSLPTASSKEWGDKGIHIDFSVGSWLLLDLNGTHTLVEYHTWADPGGAFSARLASSFATNSIPETLAAMADFARAGAACPAL